MTMVNPLLKLKPTKGVLQEILSNYGIINFDFHIPALGLSNTSVILKTGKDDYFLRILRRNRKDAGELLKEVEFMNFLNINQFPTPKVIPNNHQELITLYYDCDGGVWLCLVMTKLKGCHPSNDDFSKNLLFRKELAKRHADLHTLSEKFYKGDQTYSLDLNKNSTGIIIRSFLQQIEINLIKNSALQSKLLEISNSKLTYTSTSLPAGYLHDDLNIGNILISDSVITGFVDFDEMNYGPYISCLANGAFEFIRFTNDPQAGLEYLKLYCQYRKINHAELEDFVKLLIHRNSMFICLLVVSNGENFEFVNYHLELASKLDNLAY